MFSKKYISFIFLLVLWMPCIIKTFNLSKKKEKEESNENRTLQKKPEVDVTNLDAYPALYDAYFNDNFICRNAIIEKFNIQNIKLFGKSPIERVIIGKDNWLYLADEMDIYNRTTKFSNAELKKLLNEFERRRLFLEQENCSLYVYIIPPKIMVYPEYSKRITKRGNELSQGAQLEAYFKANSKIPVCYLLPTLVEGKKNEEAILFHTTDNHWNDEGAYVSYKKITNDLRKNFPTLEQLNRESFAVKDTLENGGNTAGMLKMETYFKEMVRHLTVKNPLSHETGKKGYEPTKDFMYPWEFERQYVNTNEQLPKALLVRDSFTGKLAPYLSESFSQLTLIFDSWKYQLHEDIVKSEKPQVMVYVIFEPFLKNILK